ncbi:MAG: ZIP family metal transporter [Candidatus Dormibacteraeota bacterium]|uniref:Permease n=1 Tax=Candidatus Aeolococcus gillhamiae TaxID=3127015 RepID=A0A2W5ZKN7_9BACT|nr:ZIP family metal transporter [Candidatus Dormibacteraeota bacterium]PZR83436.1 MAG: permease [Candidatus Dormibacter sp. RRmetagenome_bin12]
MIGILVAALTFFSTSLGGLAAVRVRDRMHLLLGFSSGAVLGVALFDVFPELISRSRSAGIEVSQAMLFVAVGFLAFFLLEKFTSLHHGPGHGHEHGRKSTDVGMVAAAGLSFHSFLDGVAIGVGFKTDLKLGVAIGIAVLAHDFVDGLNTVTIVLAHGNSLRRALRWLLLDALTPLMGATVALVAPLPSGILPYILGSFVGVFVYIGASDLLPEAREHDSPWPAAATVAGMGLLWGVTRLI